MQPNLCNSEAFLKESQNKEKEEGDGKESPIIKSLFDVKGNSKFKSAYANESKSEESKEKQKSSESSSEEEQEN